MMKRMRRLLSVLLALCVLMTVIPMSVMAEPHGGLNTDTTTASGGSTVDPTATPTVTPNPLGSNDPEAANTPTPAPSGSTAAGGSMLAVMQANTMHDGGNDDGSVNPNPDVTNPDTDGGSTITLPAPGVAIDYKNEQIRVTLPGSLPEGIEKAGISLCMEAANGEKFSLNQAFEHSDSYARDINVPTQDLTYEIWLKYGEIESDKVTLTVPARPENTFDASKLSYDVTNDLAIIGNVPTGVEIGLSTSDSAPSSFETANSDSNVVFTRLTAGTTYHVFYRIAAKDGSFASASAKANDITITSPPISTVLPAPDVSIDYQNESLDITLPGNLPESIDTAKIGMLINYERLENCFPNGNSCDKTITNEMFGMTIDIGLICGYAIGQTTQITIPTRPENTFDASKLAYDAKPGSVTISGVDAGVEVYITDNASFTPSANTTGELSADGKVEIGGLACNNTYYVFCRIAATSDSFASAWKPAPSFTTPKIPLTVMFATSAVEWNDKLSITEWWMKNNIKLVGDDGIDYFHIIGVNLDQITFEVTDEQDMPVSFPLTEIGNYEIKVKITGNAAYEQNCYFANDTAVIRIVPPMPKVGAGINYVSKMVTVNAPEGVTDAELTFAIGDSTYKTQMTGGSYRIALDGLGGMLDIELPGKSAVQLDITLVSDGAEYTYELEIPGRAVFEKPNGMTIRSDYYSIYVDNAGDCEVGLKPADTAGDEPTIFYGDDFVALTPDTEYVLYLRKPATADSFASDWNEIQTVKTKALKAVLDVSINPSEYTFTSDFELREEDIRNAIVFTDVDDAANIVELPKESYNISITDAGGQEVTLLIRDIGRYTVKVKLDIMYGYIKKYGLNNSTFDIIVKNTDFSAQIDFIDEAIIVRLPEEFEGDKSKLSLTFKMGEQQYTPEAPFAGDSKYAVSLSHLSQQWGVTLPEDWDSARTMVSVEISGEEIETVTRELEIPTRPRAKDSSAPIIYLSDTEVRIHYYNDHKLGLKKQSDAGDEPTVTADANEDGEFVFTGLTPDTEYSIYTLSKADKYNFRSLWLKLNKVVKNQIK